MVVMFYCVFSCLLCVDNLMFLILYAVCTCECMAINLMRCVFVGSPQLFSWGTIFAAFVHIAKFALTAVEPFKQTIKSTVQMSSIQLSEK